MQRPSNLRSFLGNPRAVDTLVRAIERNRLPHAMIFAGPAGVGKRTLAHLLAQLLNCLAPSETDACATCMSCHKVLSGVHPDVRELGPEGAFVKIEQIRALIAEVAFQPFEGEYRVAILDGADQMRQETANSLLKTLEEPPSRTFLILVTTNPYALLATIRSRCRMLQFGGIPHDQIEHYLVEREGINPREARIAALLSNGSLSAAVSFDAGRFQEVRGQALRFVRLLFERGGFFQISPMASALAKEKENFQLWLDLVAILLQDAYFAHVSPARMAQIDIAQELQALAGSLPISTIVSAIEAVQKLRRSLVYNLNRQIALEALYLSFVGTRGEDFGLRTADCRLKTNPQ